MTDKGFWDDYEIWEEITLSREKGLAYGARLKKTLDEGAAIREADLRVKKAIEEGRKLGIEEGIEEGKQAAKETAARRLLAKGMDIEMIARVTELEKDSIIELQ